MHFNFGACGQEIFKFKGPRETIKTCEIYHAKFEDYFAGSVEKEHKGGGSLHDNAHNNAKMELR
jgi:hypothetical protein